jgi:hypothetical protein
MTPQEELARDKIDRSILDAKNFINLGISFHEDGEGHYKYYLMSQHGLKYYSNNNIERLAYWLEGWINGYISAIEQYKVWGSVNKGKAK